MNALAVVVTSLVLAGPAEAAMPTGLPATDLALTLTDSPDPVGASWGAESSRVTYHVTVTNLGSETAFDVVVTVPPPSDPGVIPHLPAPPCVFAFLEYICTFAEIGPGATVSAEISFNVHESAPAVLQSGVATVSASNPDPQPQNNSASVSTTVVPSVGGNCDGFALEGDAGSTPVLCAIHRIGAQVPTSIVEYSFGGGTAAPGVDFVPSSGVVTFGPGETYKEIPLDFIGDTLPEPDDTFLVQLTNPVGAAILSDPSMGWQVIHNDDRGPFVGDLAHGFVHRGPVPSHPTENVADVFDLDTDNAPASYEVVLDEVSGDATPLLPAMGMIFGSPAGTGGASSLRFSNFPTMSTLQTVMVVGDGCGAGCGPDDTYRLRFYDTTLTGGRYDHVGGQESIVILQNPRSEATRGHLLFWVPDGSMAAWRAFAIAPHGSQVLRTGDVGLAGASGSITVVHDAPYGTLIGKVSAFDPANGFSFDTVLAPKPR